MNLTLKLLRVIGSPYVPGHLLPDDKDYALKLYNCAVKNKIGLTFLESLRNQKVLEEFGLETKYVEERKKYEEQLTTATRIAELFNSFQVNYAIFKSIMPFTAITNDIDIIHFGSDEEYRKALELMLRSNYVKVESQAGADAEQYMLHDLRSGKLEPHPATKDVYDVDLYQEMAASYVLYLDKSKLEKYVTETNVLGKKVKVLGSEAELITIITHSIIPEMLNTLLVYYATLHHLAKMNDSEVSRVIDIARENYVTFPLRTHFSLVAKIHKKAHGFTPGKIEDILAELGGETAETRILVKNNFKMPHRYNLITVMKTLLEKSKEAKFKRSIIKQMVYKVKPRFAKWVI